MFVKRGFLPAVLICLISLLISLIKFELKLTPKVLAQYPTITDEPLLTPLAPPIDICKGNDVSKVTCNISGGANKLYIVGVTYRNNVSVSNISGVAGLSWTPRLRQCAAGNIAYMEIWTAYGSPTDGTIDINFSGASTAIVGSVTDYSGIDPATPVENWTSANTLGVASTQCNTGSGNSNPAVLSLTASTANSILYVMTNVRSKIITNADPDYSQRAVDDAGNGTNSYIHDRVFPSAGVDNVSHTLAAVSLQQTVSGSLGDGGGTSFKLSSWTPAANELILVAVSMRNNSGGDPTVSGNGLTFVQVAKSSNVRIPVMSTYLFRAMGSSPTSGQITVNTPGNSNPVFAVASRFNGVDTSGTNGSGAIEAFVTNNAGTTDNDDMKTTITSLTNNTWAYSAGYHRNSNFTLPSGESAISINNISGTGGDTVYLSTWYESVTNPGTVTVGADNDLSGTTPWSTVAVIIKSDGGADWLIAGIVVRPQAVVPTPTRTKIYGWVYQETNNNIDRSTAEAEGLLGGIGFNLTGPINNSTTSQATPLAGLLGNYRFSNLNDGIYTVDMLSVPGNMTFFPYYTNPQVGIIVNGTEVIVDFPLITITPTGSPTPTDPFPSNSPTPTQSDITPTEQVTPTTMITPPETCLTLPTPDLVAPDHDVCLGYKPTFSANVADPNGDNVWSHYFLGDWQINGNIAAATGGLSSFTPSELDLNLSDSFWWTAVTQSSSCPDSASAPSRLLALDYTPPAQPEPPVCLLDYQNYVTGESFFTCSWNKPLSSGCGVPVDYRPYFWSTPGDGTLPWDPGWIGNQNSVTVVVEDGRELYAQLIVKDSAGNVSAASLIGGPFTAPRINYGATPTSGVLPTVTPTPTNTLTPTPGPWMQLKGGDAYQPNIMQPVPLGKYFLDLMPTPAENPNSFGLVWTNSGGGNFGYGLVSPQNWQAEASFTNAYSFSYYWEALKNRAKVVNNSVVGLIDYPIGTPVPTTTPTPTVPTGIAVDNVSSGSRMGGYQLTVSHITSGTDRLMLVGVSLNNNNAASQDVLNITYNSLPLIRAGTVNMVNDSRATIWYMVSPPVGTYDVVVTLNGTVCSDCGFVVGVVTFVRVNQSDPLGPFVSATGTSRTPSVNVTSATGEVVFDTLACEACSSVTVGSGQTQRWNTSNGGAAHIEFGAASTENGAATVTMSWDTGVSQDWVIGAVPIKP